MGDQNKPEIFVANMMLSRVVRRCLSMLSVGTHILVENPWLSYLWLMPEMLALIGLPGLYLVRIDQCMHGTPFKKPQMWLTSNPELIKDARKCLHPTHAIRLEGTATTKSSRYPVELAEAITDSWIRCSESKTRVPTSLATAAASLLRSLSDHRMDKRPGELSDEALEYKHIARSVQVGKSAVQAMRSGSSYVTVEDVEPKKFTEWLEPKKEEP